MWVKFFNAKTTDSSNQVPDAGNGSSACLDRPAGIPLRTSTG